MDHLYLNVDRQRPAPTTGENMPAAKLKPSTKTPPAFFKWLDAMEADVARTKAAAAKAAK
jgi:hypothetical protein